MYIYILLSTWVTWPVRGAHTDSRTRCASDAYMSRPQWSEFVSSDSLDTRTPTYTRAPTTLTDR